jgi:PAS domain S-box-containing protein
LTALSSQLATIFEKSRLDAELAEYTATLERRVEERTAEIRHQQTRTQAILDALGEGVIVTDIQGNIEYVNAAGLALTGYGTQEALGRNPRLWQSGQTPLSVYQEMWSTILLGRTWRGEIVNKRRDGTLYHVDLTIAPIPILDAPGLIAGFAGVQHDVSLRKRAEEEIHRALAQEKELGELKSRFISMTSHEFRTPLTTILSSAEMLEHYGPRWSEDKKLVHIHRIQSSVRNMTRLLDDVLILGRAEAGRFEFNPIPLDLVQFCQDLIEEMQLSAGPKYALELTCEAAGAQAHMDEKLLRQILTNLLSNAIKYSPDGGTVHLTLACQAGRVTFQVRDDGIGIPDEDQARLFETFHRARNIGNIPGTGLGLAIVKKSVDLHGGTIEVASQVGQGTTFTVTLPMENTA